MSGHRRCVGARVLERRQHRARVRRGLGLGDALALGHPAHELVGREALGPRRRRGIWPRRSRGSCAASARVSRA